jgi:disulfide bond formation protein DsbB
MFTPEPWVLTLNHNLSLLTIIGAIALVAWLIALVLKKDFSWIREYALPIGFFVTLAGAFMTLFYSEYIGYLPCALCWFQRIFLYPQIVLFGLAWWKKDRGVTFYTLWLSVIGFILASYHHYIQMGYKELLPCPATGMFADCAKPSFVEFGFVTFPFMAIVLFGFLILLSYTARKRN